MPTDIPTGTESIPTARKMTRAMRTEKKAESVRTESAARFRCFR